MKKIGALVGMIAVIGMLFPAQASRVTAATQDEYSTYNDSSAVTSGDVYAIRLGTNSNGNETNLDFTLAGKKYALMFTSYSPELMLCAVQKATQMKAAEIDILFLESLSTILNTNLFFALHNGEKFDCIKNSSSRYESVYASSTEAYAVTETFSNATPATFTITPKNGTSVRTVTMDTPDIDLFSCALAHEEGTTFAGLDKNLLILVDDMIHTSANYGTKNEIHYITVTDPLDCIKGQNGVYKKQTNLTHGDYIITTHMNTVPKVNAEVTIKNTKTNVEHTIFFTGNYTDVGFCAAEEVLGTRFEDMDSDLRAVIAYMFYGNAQLLKETGVSLQNDCAKDSDNMYFENEDTTRIADRASAGVSMVEARIQEAEAVVKNLKRKEHSSDTEYSPSAIAADYVLNAQESFKHGKKAYRDKEYTMALMYLRESIIALQGITTEPQQEDVYTLYATAFDSLNEQYSALIKQGSYNVQRAKFKEIAQTLDTAYALYLSGEDGQSRSLVKAAQAQIDVLK
jgi:hypothetical protein